MEKLQWTACLILGVSSALLILLNWLGFIGYAIEVRRGRKGGYSFAPPFLCGVFGAVACLVCPLPGVSRLAWLPPLLDLSILLLLVCCVLHVVARLTGKRSPFDGRLPEPPVERRHAEIGPAPDGGER